MSDERYQLMYSGLVSGAERTTVKALIHERFQMPLAELERWFGREKAVIVKDLTRDQAWKTQYLLETLGVEVIVVPQTRSNLSLAELQLAPSRRQEPAIKVSHYQPSGIAQFEAQPLQRQPRSSGSVVRRKQVQAKNGNKSFKLTHMIAAAIIVVVASYAGKHVISGGGSLTQPLASWNR